jgi:hypothetical protein
VATSCPMLYLAPDPAVAARVRSRTATALHCSRRGGRDPAPSLWFWGKSGLHRFA